MSVGLSFEGVSKAYDQTSVLSDVTFRAEPGELVVLVGPSGCGKSTLMRVVAGLETLSSGVIRAGDRVLNDLPPHERGVGMVFQSYALYPHLTVRENLAFPLYVKKASPDEQKREVERVAGLLGLTPLLERLPAQLSGGQRQRVAIGRCLVRKPDIYCFDEPLSNLDASLRTQIRLELKALQRTVGKTTLYVTHDQVEAMTLADRIVVLHKGIAMQVGSPRELYRSPKNLFVATFVGSPPMTLLRGEVSGGRFVSGALDIPAERPDGPVILGVRPEEVRVAGEGTPATIRAVEPIGETGYLHLAIEGATLVDAVGERREGHVCASVPGRDAFGFREGEGLHVAIGDALYFDVETGQRIEARP